MLIHIVSVINHSLSICKDKYFLFLNTTHRYVYMKAYTYFENLLHYILPATSYTHIL